MTSRPAAAGRRWFFDENLEALANALEAVGLNVVCPGHPACPDISRGTSDEHWIPIVARARWPILTHDERIRSDPAPASALRLHGATVFFLTGGHWTSWDKLRLIARHWDRIERAASSADRDGPRLHKITPNGVKPVRG